MSVTDGTWTDRLCWLLSPDGAKFLARAPEHRPGDLGRKIDAARTVKTTFDAEDLFGGFRR